MKHLIITAIVAVMLIGCKTQYPLPQRPLIDCEAEKPASDYTIGWDFYIKGKNQGKVVEVRDTCIHDVIFILADEYGNLKQLRRSTASELRKPVGSKYKYRNRVH